MKTRRPCIFAFILGTAVSMVLFLSLQSHAAKGVVPRPPQFVMQKQLPGQDPYWVYRPTFSPDNRYAAGFLHSSKKIIIWDLKEDRIETQIPQSMHGMPGLDGYEFSKDGKNLLLIYRDYPLKFIDIFTGRLVRSIPINADPRKVYDYAFSPDMKLLALATTNGIKLWDIDKGKQLKIFLSGKAVSGLDMLIYRTKKGKLVRLLAYGLLTMGPVGRYKDVAGIIDIDSGKSRPVLNDVPKDKVNQGKTTFFWVSFKHGGGYLLVGYSTFPPQVKAGVYLVNTRTGKYLANHALDQFILTYDMYYLWKPYYGYLVCTKDMTGNPYRITTEFLVITRKSGLKVIDQTREDKLALQSITVSRDQRWALIAIKRSGADPSRVYLYKIVPKK